MLKVILALVLLVAAVGLALLTWEGPRAKATLTPTANHGQLALTPHTRLATPAEEEHLDSQAEARSVATSEAFPDTLWIGGTVAVAELDGSVTRDALSGEMTLYLESQQGFAHPRPWRTKVIVQAGRWQTSLPRRADGLYGAPDDRRPLTLSEARTRGVRIDRAEFVGDLGRLEPLRIEPEVHFGAQDLEVWFRRRAPFTVHVTDAESGAPLRAVSIYEGSVFEALGGLLPHSEPRATIASESASPIDVTAENKRGEHLGSVGVQVGCPGYAWKEAYLYMSEGGQAQVQLERGGSLRIICTGEVPPLGTELRVFAPYQPKPIANRSLDESQAFDFDGLVPGEVRIRVEDGNWNEAPRVLASTNATISASSFETLVLALEIPPEPVLVPLSGTLILPEEWELERFGLSFTLLEETRSGPSGYRALHQGAFEKHGDRYEFQLQGMHVGHYRMKFLPLGYVVDFDLGPEGRTGLTLEVPEPVDLTVLLRDEDSGQTSTLDLLQWVSSFPGESVPGQLRHVCRVPGEDRFRLRVPLGELTLVSDAKGYTRATTTVEAIEGMDVVLDVRSHGPR